MADSEAKIALRNAFAKKLSKTEASSIYLLKSEYSDSGNQIDKSIMAEQMIGLYNGLNNTSLDWRDYVETTEDQWIACATDFVNGYNGT